MILYYVGILLYYIRARLELERVEAIDFQQKTDEPANPKVSIELIDSPKQKQKSSLVERWTSRT
jgi:hypothetical protein